jgi:simple sugar transport system ATP-binding protein
VALLDIRNISMHFGAIHALTDLSFSVGAGEVVGLMGDNGAGKSTMVKIIAGNFRPTHGEIAVEDGSVTSTGRSMRAPRASRSSIRTWRWPTI